MLDIPLINLTPGAQMPLAGYSPDNCQEMWCHVLLEAFRNALGIANPPIGPAAVSAAKHYIGSREFDAVCGLAGIRSELVVEAYHELLMLPIGDRKARIRP